MPRLQPPSGFSTAAAATERLQVSQAMLSRLVSEGKLKRYGPPNRKHKFYKDSEIEAILASRESGFEVKQEKHRSIMSLASAQDMPAIVEISRAIFNADGSQPIPAEPRLAWLRANPETFFVLRDLAGTIVGYASILPLAKTTIDRFIRDEIQAEDIAGNDVLLFQPGRPLHLYIMAIGIDPQYPASAKHEYGARLVNGLFTFLLELAQRGVEIASIVARSHKPDGIRLLRKMGFPQLPPLTPGKHLFIVEPERSGLHILMKYTELLKEWKASHQVEASTVNQQIARAGPRLERRQQPAPTIETTDLPPGLEIATVFAQRHFPGERPEWINRQLQTIRENGNVPMIPGRYKVGKATAAYALDAAGQRAFYEVMHTRGGFERCSQCPHDSNQAEQGTLL